jgi:hypothetical protein
MILLDANYISSRSTSPLVECINSWYISFNYRWIETLVDSAL